MSYMKLCMSSLARMTPGRSHIQCHIQCSLPVSAFGNGRIGSQKGGMVPSHTTVAFPVLLCACKLSALVLINVIAHLCWRG